MIIRTVKMENFRCYDHKIFECTDETSLILGGNGSGKTSILEAIYEGMQGKSFRATDKDILKRDRDFYRVELLYENGDKTIVSFDGVKKQFVAGDKKTARLSRRNQYPVVLFLPSDLHLVESSPARRRDYFDRVIAGLDNVYGAAVSRYNKALRQRNELLKRPGVRVADLFSWDVMLAKYGATIVQKRREYLQRLNDKITPTYQTIAENDDEVRVRCIGEASDVEEENIRKLTQGFARDLVVGYTGFGAHRDKFDFTFNKELAQGSASRGEVRSMILAMKFIEAEMIFYDTGRRPVVLLDDVFSELDEKRQKCLVKNFKDNQAVITSVG